MASQENQENNVRNVKSAWSRLKGFPDECVGLVITSAREAKNFGKEDPRRIVHSFKVGLAITIVSLLYYFDFLYDGLGVSAMWAVITVVVVFEFSVGATFGRGINRAIATFIGGLLGVAAHRLASSTGNKAEPIVLGFSVFFITSIATFIRLFPKMKERHDYGCMIFILTFCLISVSGYRDSEVIEMAHTRLSTVMIGLSATGLICIFICPVWAGEDLHNLTATNIEKLGISLEAFQRKYFETTTIDKNQENKPPVDGYKVVISSKSKEESLVNFARWEPRHGKFKYRHPWDQYVKIAGHTRECAHRIDALNCYLHSEIPTPPIEISKKIEELCTTMSLECSHALKELAIVIKKMTRSPNSEAHLNNAEIAAKNLKLLVQNGIWPESDPLDVIPAAAVALLLIEIVCSTVKIADSVHRLSILSKFKSVDPARTPARFGVTVE